ncbi:MAG: HAD hydrolase family protein [Candidatus Paceibacterota bacterium]
MDSVVPSVKEKIKNLKAVVFDSYGVFFSEVVSIRPKEGEYTATRSHIDGQGISLIRSAGLLVALVSTEKLGLMDSFGVKLNNLPSVLNGDWKPLGVFTGDKAKNKTEAIEGWLSENGISWDECAYMGDDVGDAEIMKKVGIAVAPQQAETVIKDIAHVVTDRRGGDGAIRDFCNILLEVKGVDPLSLSRK